MKRLVFIFFGVFALCASAQKETNAEAFNLKKTLREARSYEKADNFQKLHETVQTAFTKWPEAKREARLWHYEMLAQYELAKSDNVKLFLKNKPDTASYFSHVLETYRAGLHCDSLDRLPDSKQRVRPEYTRHISETLTLLRNNLRSGGRYYLRKQNYAAAFSHLDLYLSTIGSPLLMTNAPAYTKATDPLDKDSVEMAVLAVMAGSKAKSYQDALKYAALAELDTARRATLIDVRAQAHLGLGDTITYYKVLAEGFEQYPTDVRFYKPIIDHYNATHEFDKSLTLVNRLIALEPSNDIFWSLKGKLFEATACPDSAEAVYNHILDLGGKYAETYASLGNVYIEQAHQAAARMSVKSSATRQALTALYRKARQALEQARELAPDTPLLWRDGLREAYFKLNEGKALRSLEKTLSAGK